MAQFEIDIIETLQRRVTVEAESAEEARELVEDLYYKEEYLLDAENSNVSTEFTEVE